EEEIKKQGGKFFIIRTSKLFGPPGEILGAKKSFIDIMLELSEKQEEIEVVDAEESCFTYTYDLARKTREILEAGARKYDYGIYHLVNQGPCTWFECARKLFEITGKTVKIKPVPAEKIKRPAKRPRYSALINSRGPKLRHWEAAAREYLSKIS
ncbi:sugar nucleotide-binding protein, partial [Patescibacteria group bacterium]|nr:sugar nucleotide-binding protein [Patescibacteria group bacterium]